MRQSPPVARRKRIILLDAHHAAANPPSTASVLAAEGRQPLPGIDDRPFHVHVELCVEGKVAREAWRRKMRVVTGGPVEDLGCPDPPLRRAGQPPTRNRSPVRRSWSC
jgi:hypothetical protein